MLLPSAVLSLAQLCAPNVAPSTMAALVQSESSGNPYAIGVVGRTLASQPRTKAEAVETANALIQQGENISLGLSQVNIKNFKGLGITVPEAFEPCANLQAGSKVLSECYHRYSKMKGEGQGALQDALSCYYSNNDTRGYQKEGKRGDSYVMRIAVNNEKITAVPAIQFKPEDVKEVDAKEKTAANDNATPAKALETGNPKEDTTTSTPDESMSWDVLGDFSNHSK